MLHRRVGRFAVGLALFAWLLSGVPVDATSHASGTHPRTTSTGTKTSGASTKTTGGSTKATRTAKKLTPPKPKASTSTTSTHHKAAVPRNSKARIARSEQAKSAFMAQSGFPKGRTTCENRAMTRTTTCG